MPPTWKPLEFPSKGDTTPPLLIKCEFGPSDYKIWLTDLSYIWTESLDRRQINRRALNADTSIDPSEDSTQMRLLLSSIADALRQNPGTEMHWNASEDIKQIILYTSTPLPHPLQPLEWSVQLMLAPSLVFAAEFVTPLLSQQLTAQVEKASLLRQLEEKDRVISRLIEKLQGDGVNLGKIFPGAVSSKSGSGPIARGLLAKSVKGLREFDRDQWETQLANESRVSGDMRSILAQIFDHDDGKAGEKLPIVDYGEWWKRVGRGDLQREEATPSTVGIDVQKKSVEEDEFQRQLTPTKSVARTPSYQVLRKGYEPKASSSFGQENPVKGDSTTDESDDDLRSSRSKSLPSRKDVTTASSPTYDTNYMQSELMDLDDGGSVAPASASDTDRSPTKTHLVPKPKQKLGKIGCKVKDSSPEGPAMPMSNPKLGKIGGKPKVGKIGGTDSLSNQSQGPASNNREDVSSPKLEPKDQAAARSERRGPTIQQPPEPSPPRETSQERANRKRIQLKRELENKSQTVVKKKRRF